MSSIRNIAAALAVSIAAFIAASPAVAATGKEVALLGKLTSYCQPPSSTSPPMGVAQLSTRVVVPASPGVGVLVRTLLPAAI
jgi:hypothetical protein